MKKAVKKAAKPAPKKRKAAPPPPPSAAAKAAPKTRPRPPRPTIDEVMPGVRIETVKPGPATTYSPEAAKLLIDAVKASYSPAVAEVVVLRIKTLPKTIAQICADDPKLPSKETVYNWLATQEDFAREYWQAKVIQALLYAEELLGHALDGSKDWVDVTNKDGETRRELNIDHVMRSRLIVDTLKWYISKVLPRLFGDKLEALKDDDDGKAEVKEYRVPATRPILAPPAPTSPDEPRTAKPAKSTKAKSTTKRKPTAASKLVGGARVGA